jgi:predicted ATPase
MKIELRNFGPIDHFEFDLDKDLHVVYGENNIGKSSIINAIYIVLNSWIEISKMSAVGKNNLNYTHLDKEDSINEKFVTTFKEIENKLSGGFSEIIINSDFLNLSLEYFQGPLDDDAPPYFFTSLDYKSKNEKPFNQSLFFFPASRSGMYRVMASMGEILAKFSQYRNQLNISNLTIPTLTFPESEYFLNLSSINSNKASNYNDLVNKIEKNIIGGEVYFDNSSKKLRYKNPETGLDLDLHESSSMVSEIAPIIAHLKYILPNSNSILFIEEPEAHLHPKVQIEMMRIYAELVNAGVKVVMTTHSDFMMHELTNLILAKKINADKVASYHLIMGKNGSYDAGDMKATNEGIEDYNFTDVALKQYERRIEILDKLNEEDAVVK